MNPATLSKIAVLVGNRIDQRVPPNGNLNLIDDLNLDSLDRTDMVFDLEDAFEIEIESKDQDKWRTLGDVADCVDRIMEGPP